MIPKHRPHELTDCELPGKHSSVVADGGLHHGVRIAEMVGANEVCCEPGSITRPEGTRSRWNEVRVEGTRRRWKGIRRGSSGGFQAAESLAQTGARFDHCSADTEGVQALSIDFQPVQELSQGREVWRGIAGRSLVEPGLEGGEALIRPCHDSSQIRSYFGTGGSIEYPLDRVTRRAHCEHGGHVPDEHATTL